MGRRDKQVIWFEDLKRQDVGLVGGKNASLGEMVRVLAGKGIKVPPGFATSADVFRDYLKANSLNDVIAVALDTLASGKKSLPENRVSNREI